MPRRSCTWASSWSTRRRKSCSPSRGRSAPRITSPDALADGDDGTQLLGPSLGRVSAGGAGIDPDDGVLVLVWPEAGAARHHAGSGAADDHGTDRPVRLREIHF